MKIGIITIHFGTNYGSALQTYALSNFIKEHKWKSKKNIEVVEVIDYIPPRYSKKQRYLHLNKHMNICKRIVYSIVCAPSEFLYHKIFSEFLRKYTPLGDEVNTNEELQKKYENFDLLIAGSDQIWNSDFNGGFDSAYFLEFASNKSVKSAYAASCGKLAFSQEELKKMTSALKLFAGISVREQQAKELLTSIGFENTLHVLDPIFLLNKERWGNLVGRKRSITENYLFIYLLDGDTERTIDEAIKIAHKLGLKTVIVSFGHIWSKDARVDYYFIRKTPCEFVELMLNSSFIVTNSFHGVAFSINFNKQFVAFKRVHYNSRLDSISKMFGLQNRFHDSSKELNIDELLKDRIDYVTVNALIEMYRRNSIDYLESMVELVNEKSL